jgi:DNA-binding response OmpR family regulator
LQSGFASSKPDAQSILLVDDDAGLCHLMSEFLSSHYFRLTAAHDGVTGFSKALAGGFDLILLDIMLPIQVLKRLREKKAHTPVIMLTARTAHRDRIAGLDAGADDYIPKPFAPHEADRIQTLVTAERRLLQDISHELRSPRRASAWPPSWRAPLPIARLPRRASTKKFAVSRTWSKFCWK